MVFNDDLRTKYLEAFPRKAQEGRQDIQEAEKTKAPVGRLSSPRECIEEQIKRLEVVRAKFKEALAGGDKTEIDLWQRKLREASYACGIIPPEEPKAPGGQYDLWREQK